MLAIAEACRDGRLAAEVKVVLAPADEGEGLLRASALGLGIQMVPPGDRYGERLLHALEGVDVICLAGFLRLLPSEVLHRFPDRILNIHPALLPQFGGKGMYGLKVHEAVLDAGASETGCTVHLVTEAYDEGKILLQRRCPVAPGDTAETLAARVLELEHGAYVEALRSVIFGASV